MCTAIKRKKPSVPATYLYTKKLIKGRSLDYGCGYGLDAICYFMEKYDIVFFKDKPKGKFDTILCTYVLNTIESTDEIIDVIDDIRNLLEDNGKAYITVRRDLKKARWSRRGYQCNLFLDLNILYSLPNRFCIYETAKYE